MGIIAVFLGLQSEEDFQAEEEQKADDLKKAHTEIEASTRRHVDRQIKRARDRAIREDEEEVARARARRCWACGRSGGDQCWWCHID